jgi:hypothetical protein
LAQFAFEGKQLCCPCCVVEPNCLHG